MREVAECVATVFYDADTATKMRNVCVVGGVEERHGN